MDLAEPIALPVHEVIEGPQQLVLGLSPLTLLKGGLRDERPAQAAVMDVPVEEAA
jgi:hypothetical protein